LYSFFLSFRLQQRKGCNTSDAIAHPIPKKMMRVFSSVSFSLLAAGDVNVTMVVGF
jgi:hypothetical protein